MTCYKYHFTSLHFTLLAFLYSKRFDFAKHNMTSKPNSFEGCKARENLWFYEKIEENRIRFESGQFTTTILLEQKFKPWAQVLQRGCCVYATPKFW